MENKIYRKFVRWKYCKELRACDRTSSGWC